MAIPRGLGVFLILATAVSAGSASEVRTQFRVGATVLAHASLRVRSEPVNLTITPDAVRRGFIEVLEPTRIEVSNNSPHGYALLVQPQMMIFSALRVRSAGGEVLLGNEGGMIVEHGQHGITLPLELTYRFDLASSVAPGEYPWPVHLAVQALEP
ncbi:MAG TPA: hypothetical protein VLW26_12175 [Steroidobacteraceae bacterium]|nr:hypothetical protein [Steroidobacteraceae bacterium]